METPTPTADPSDVRELIETDLTDTDLNAQLGHAAARNERANDVEAMDTYTKGRIEALLAALRIRSTLDRAITSGQSESSTVSFEGSVLAELRLELEELDPSGTLASRVRRNRDRKITSTGPTEPSEGSER